MVRFQNHFCNTLIFLLVPQGRDVHNRRWSEAQPTDRKYPILFKPRMGRDYQPQQS
jgi:hypothetical protein